MHSTDLHSQRISGLRSRILGRRLSMQVAVGIMAVLAIALAFLLRPNSSAQEAEPTVGPAKTSPTAVVVSIPTVVPPTVAPTSPPERFHTVVQGDTLSSIAEKYYGDVTKYDKIFEANKDILTSPDSLQLGQKLRIPE